MAFFLDKPSHKGVPQPVQPLQTNFPALQRRLFADNRLDMSYPFPLSSLLNQASDLNLLPQKLIGHTANCSQNQIQAFSGFPKLPLQQTPQLGIGLPATNLEPPALDVQAVLSLCALRNNTLISTGPSTGTPKNDSSVAVETSTQTFHPKKRKARKPVVDQGQAEEARNVLAPKKKVRRKSKRKIKYCKVKECGKYAQGGTDFCVSHGGGRRCTVPGCKTGARGSTRLCILHGGGKRCQKPGCAKSAIGATSFCIKHGGGKRCTFSGCKKAAQGATSFCVRHGGGRRCAKVGCNLNAKSRSQFCRVHSDINEEVHDSLVARKDN